MHSQMDLKTYLGETPRGEFAKAIGISTVYLLQLLAHQDGREPSPRLCMRIEEETRKQVRVWDLRPDDWHEIWPMLIGSRGAPRIRPHSKKKVA